jgi:hypothetical protein
MEMNKTIWLLWLQGWDNIPWLQNQVVESWKINNPDWTIEYVTLKNLKNYVNDIDYIYEENKNISNAAKSDIIRLSLLKNHGGIWADSTMLCMQPLNHWVFDAVKPSGFWMYHGNGGEMLADVGPASWFIVSKKNSYMITKWKEMCDDYWFKHNYTDNYFWMDSLFKYLVENDMVFKDYWGKTPYLYCELEGQSHTLAHDNGMVNNNPELKELLLMKPPYVLKFWNCWNHIFPNINEEACINSTGFYALQLSKRKKIFKHVMF